VASTLKGNTGGFVSTVRGGGGGDVATTSAGFFLASFIFRNWSRKLPSLLNVLTWGPIRRKLYFGRQVFSLECRTNYRQKMVEKCVSDHFVCTDS
jgi:hypothetical protein